MIDTPWLVIQPGQTLSDVEKNLILWTLRRLKENRTATALALGISIRTLRNKLATYRFFEQQQPSAAKEK